MARKPTRFWHPARRLLLRAQAQAQSLVARPDASVNLDDLRPRLQHYLRAMYGESVMIDSLAPPKRAGWATRTLLKIALAKPRSMSESDAACMRLPSSLPVQGSVSPLEQYRVMAVQHAERMRRGSARFARDVTTDLERDLYQLAEAAAVDAQIVSSQPGLRAALDAARANSMAERPKPRFRTSIELRVEHMIRRAWQAGRDDSALKDVPAVPVENDAESNATWARRTAVALEVEYGRKATRAYRRAPEITLWQTTISSRLPEEQPHALETEMRQLPNGRPPDAWKPRSHSLIPGGAPSQSARNTPGNRPGESESGKASADAGTDGSGSGGEDGTPNDEDASESNSEEQSDQSRDKNATADSAGAHSANGAGGVSGQSAVSHSDNAVDDSMLVEGQTFRYPEWDHALNGFNASGTMVRVVPPSLESADWATNTLHEHARETQRAKRQFERLRSHRSRLRRQEQGEELDLEACVEAMVDRRMGVAPTDRLYAHVRPGRRELAITLLIDVSGSTGQEVAGNQRVIDIERIAALVATAAFDALGDDYAILAFSSSGPANVRVHTLKEFGEKNSTLVLQRISALAPHGTTRLGAAVRHATATLSKNPAPHRLLLILSDGKPNDYDWYFTDYAIQDSRQAITQARLDGIHPFCITVDTADHETYLADIFGSTGYRVVSRPSQLSSALLVAVQRMIGGSS